jgi:hypothetical protein
VLHVDLHGSRCQLLDRLGVCVEGGDLDLHAVLLLEAGDDLGVDVVGVVEQAQWTGLVLQAIGDGLLHGVGAVCGVRTEDGGAGAAAGCGATAGGGSVAAALVIAAARLEQRDAGAEQHSHLCRSRQELTS